MTRPPNLFVYDKALKATIAAEFSPKEKVRSYRIARRSAAECEAILDVVEAVVGLPSQVAAARTAVGEVVALPARSVEVRVK